MSEGNNTPSTSRQIRLVDGVLFCQVDLRIGRDLSFPGSGPKYTGISINDRYIRFTAVETDGRRGEDMETGFRCIL